HRSPNSNTNAPSTPNDVTPPSSAFVSRASLRPTQYKLDEAITTPFSAPPLRRCTTNSLIRPPLVQHATTTCPPSPSPSERDLCESDIGDMVTKSYMERMAELNTQKLISSDNEDVSVSTWWEGECGGDRLLPPQPSVRRLEALEPAVAKTRLHDPRRPQQPSNTPTPPSSGYTRPSRSTHPFSSPSTPPPSAPSSGYTRPSRSPTSYSVFFRISTPFTLITTYCAFVRLFVTPFRFVTTSCCAFVRVFVTPLATIFVISICTPFTFVTTNFRHAPPDPPHPHHHRQRLRQDTHALHYHAPPSPQHHHHILRQYTHALLFPVPPHHHQHHHLSSGASRPSLYTYVRNASHQLPPHLPDAAAGKEEKQTK
ncbi:hypothetical protein Pcinc_031436, partial [Petrolisthes cinctipes]